MSVKLTHASMDISKRPGSKEEVIVLRGVIDHSRLNEILADKYQREIGSTARIERLAEAIKSSSLPDLELGMRGDKVREVRDQNGDGMIYYLQDPVYVIDGLQRLSSARHLMQAEPGYEPRLGALVHLNTTEGWERERFRILNQERAKLSSNVLLRNMCPDCAAVDMLHKLSTMEDSFVLHNRVSWKQNMAREEIISAVTMCKTVGVLHSRFGPGGRASGYDELARGLDKIMSVVGRTTVRDNTKAFFALLDECYGIRRIVFAGRSTHMRSTFLRTLADVLTRHTNFWKERKLFVEKDLKVKIAKFPMNDPEVVRLAGAGGKAQDLLYQLMVEHINSGKRTRRLTLVDGVAPNVGGESEENEEES